MFFLCVFYSERVQEFRFLVNTRAGICVWDYSINSSRPGCLDYTKQGNPRQQGNSSGLKAKRKQQRLSGVVCCGLADILRCYTQLRLTAVLFRVCFAMPSFGALGHTLSTWLVFAVAFLCVSFVSQGECQATQAPPTRKYKWSFKKSAQWLFLQSSSLFLSSTCL